MANNEEDYALFWGIMGSITGTVSPVFISGPKLNDGIATAIMITVGLLVAPTYTAAYNLRQRPAMRARRGWMGSILLNLAVAATVTTLSLVRSASYSGVVGLATAAFAVFALGEVAKPIADFGLVQAFLRLPLQTALLCYFGGGNDHLDEEDQVGAVAVTFTALFLVAGTVWQAYYAVGEEWPAVGAADAGVAGHGADQ